MIVEKGGNVVHAIVDDDPAVPIGRMGRDFGGGEALGHRKARRWVQIAVEGRGCCAMMVRYDGRG